MTIRDRIARLTDAVENARVLPGTPQPPTPRPAPRPAPRQLTAHEVLGVGMLETFE